ncbi:MAG: shikimate kinase [Candidatus Limnocylindria bacterium]
MAEACRLILVGMMGSGKTTIGRLLSERIGWPYLDNDELLRRLVAATPRQIAARSGEERLRRSEAAALRLGLEQPPPCIIGAAAGTILDPASRRAIQACGLVVWLRATSTTLQQRAAGAAHRPWLDSHAAAWTRRAVEERYPLYGAVADHVVDVDRTAAEAAAVEIGEWLSSTHPECRISDRAPPNLPAVV